MKGCLLLVWTKGSGGMSRVVWLVLFLVASIWLAGIVFNVMDAAINSLFILTAMVIGTKLFSSGGRKI
jgi:hypothetical protein